jgi:hypothetical protein
MRDEIVLMGSDFGRMIELSAALHGKNYDVTIIHATTSNSVVEATASSIHPRAMLIGLNSSENVADVRALMSGKADTRFLFLTPERPPHAALARVVRSYGGAILSARDANVVVISTLIAMSSRSSAMADAG